MARDAVVDLLDAVANGGIGLGERKERTFTELSDDPSQRDLYSNLHLGFIFRFSRTRRNNCSFVMFRHLLIRTIDVRLVEAGLGDVSSAVKLPRKQRFEFDLRQAAGTRECLRWGRTRE